MFNKSLSLILILSGLSLNLFSAEIPKNTFKCDWIKSDSHSEAFYRPAHLTFTLNDSLKLVEDTFLYRRYTPCWVGNHVSCAFGYTYYNDVWNIDEQSEVSLKISTEGAYWDAELSLNFQKSIREMEINETTIALISGDDGDGVWFNKEKFSCTKLN